MNFHGIFLLNMLENDDSKLQNKVWSTYHFKHFQKKSNFKNHMIAPTPSQPPNLESSPYPAEGGRFYFFR